MRREEFFEKSTVFGCCNCSRSLREAIVNIRMYRFFQRKFIFVGAFAFHGSPCMAMNIRIESIYTRAGQDGHKIENLKNEIARLETSIISYLRSMKNPKTRNDTKRLAKIESQVHQWEKQVEMEEQSLVDILERKLAQFDERMKKLKGDVSKHVLSLDTTPVKNYRKEMKILDDYENILLIAIRFYAVKIERINERFMWRENLKPIAQRSSTNVIDSVSQSQLEKFQERLKLIKKLRKGYQQAKDEFHSGAAADQIPPPFDYLQPDHPEIRSRDLPRVVFRRFFRRFQRNNIPRVRFKQS